MGNVIPKTQKQAQQVVSSKSLVRSVSSISGNIQYTIAKKKATGLHQPASEDFLWTIQVNASVYRKEKDVKKQPKGVEWGAQHQNKCLGDFSNPEEIAPGLKFLKHKDQGTRFVHLYRDGTFCQRAPPSQTVCLTSSLKEVTTEKYCLSLTR